MKNIEKEDFYQRCADILQVEYTYIRTLPYRRRWGQRSLGNGRFQDHGLIRYYGANHIHISLTRPKPVNKTFASAELALAFLQSFCTL